MKKVVVYEVWVGDQRKFASISYEEANDYLTVLFNATKVLGEIKEYERVPVDHRAKSPQTHSLVKYGKKHDKVVEEIYKT